MQTSTTLINQLPLSVFGQVCQILSYTRQYRTLFSYILADKRSYNEGIPYLYHSVHLRSAKSVLAWFRSLDLPSRCLPYGLTNHRSRASLHRLQQASSHLTRLTIDTFPTRSEIKDLEILVSRQIHMVGPSHSNSIPEAQPHNPRSESYTSPRKQRDGPQDRFDPLYDLHVEQSSISLSAPYAQLSSAHCYEYAGAHQGYMASSSTRYRGMEIG